MRADIEHIFNEFNRRVKEERFVWQQKLASAEAEIQSLRKALKLSDEENSIAKDLLKRKLSELERVVKNQEVELEHQKIINSEELKRLSGEYSRREVELTETARGKAVKLEDLILKLRKDMEFTRAALSDEVAKCRKKLAEKDEQLAMMGVKLASREKFTDELEHKLRLELEEQRKACEGYKNRLENELAEKDAKLKEVKERCDDQERVYTIMQREKDEEIIGLQKRWVEEEHVWRVRLQKEEEENRLLKDELSKREHELSLAQRTKEYDMLNMRRLLEDGITGVGTNNTTIGAGSALGDKYVTHLGGNNEDYIKSLHDAEAELSDLRLQRLKLEQRLHMDIVIKQRELDNLLLTISTSTVKDGGLDKRRVGLESEISNLQRKVKDEINNILVREHKKEEEVRIIRARLAGKNG
ncbi:MAG: hypothetical protein WC955_01470 [Elusimicrobiota bacterium]